MKKIKQISLLALLLFISSLSFSQTFLVNKINYTVNEGTQTVSVVKKSPVYSGDIVIPSIVTNEDVTYSVTNIGDDAFSDCHNLTNITIPNSVTSIGDNAFLRCSSLTSITIPNSVTSIGEYAFTACSSLTSITIPNSVISIRDHAFAFCSSLTSITIPNSVISIGDDAFYECLGLTSITIPNSVTSIGEYAFAICSNVTSITIPNSVKSIGEYAFYDCSSLTSITIPNSVKSIGNRAFYDCTSLESVIVDIATPLSILEETFFGGYNATLYVPVGSKSAYQEATEWKNFKFIEEKTITNTQSPISSSATIIKAYNLQGIEVPADTKNELIILLYDNGTTQKVFQD